MNGTRIATLAFMICQITLRVTANYTLQEIKNNPGIYFGRLYDVKFSPTTWSLVTFIDMEPFRYNTTEIPLVINDIEQSNHCVEYRAVCVKLHKWLELLKTRERFILGMQRDLLETMAEVEAVEPSGGLVSTTKRDKRFAPIGFVGFLSKSLFGTLTKEDGAFYYNRIERLNQGQLDLATLAKEESHIIERRLASVTSELKMVKEGMLMGCETYKYTRQIFRTLSKDVDRLQHMGAVDGLANEINNP